MTEAPARDCLLVTARLAGGLAGDRAPNLDSLLVWMLAIHHPKGVPGYKVDRALPPPPQAEVPIPIARRTLAQQTPGGPVAWEVPRCSDPILGCVAADHHEHFVKKIGVEHAGLLDPKSRTVVSTTNTWTKSYRLPLRKRTVDRVCWFAVGNRKGLLTVLRRVRFLGKKVSCGHGLVAEWTVDRIDADYTWFAPWDGRGTVLMRTLPIGDWLPADLTGYRRDFGGVVDPYWHPDRFGEIVVPC